MEHFQLSTHLLLIKHFKKVTHFEGRKVSSCVKPKEIHSIVVEISLTLHFSDIRNFTWKIGVIPNYY